MNQPTLAEVLCWVDHMLSVQLSERGGRVPTLLTMTRLAKALGVSPMTLAAAALEDISGGAGNG